MVWHHIQQDLQAELVRRRHQLLVVLHRAEVVFNRIFVDRAVTVIVGRGIVVVVDRRKPKRRHSEILQIWQVLLNALQVAAVIGLCSAAVVRAGSGSFRLVVAGIAVGETVGHDQVNDIIARDALKLSFLRRARQQRQSHAGLTGSRLQIDTNSPGFAVGKETEPHECVLAVRLSLYLGDRSSRIMY